MPIEDGTLPNDLAVDQNLKIAREFLAEALKWGKHVVVPFSPLVIRDVILAYETRLVTMEKAHEADIKDLEQRYEQRMSELHGKIGGLQKQLNKQEKASAKANT